MNRKLVFLLAGGVVFRAAGYLAAGPLLAPSDDSARYAHGALVALFSDPFAPSGYPIFLAGLHRISPSAVTVSLAQHCLGLLTVGLFWRMGQQLTRVSGLPPRLAAIPAVFVAFSGDQWFFEHALMTETLFTVLVVGAVFALLRATADADTPPRLAWVATAGAAMGAASVVRPVGFVTAGFCLAWLLVAGRQRVRPRIATGGVYAAAAAVVLVAYLAGAGGAQNGLGSYAGWMLYGRVATFAECRDFSPPTGTRGLCESRPPDARPGIYFYLFSSGAAPGQVSPAALLFHAAPAGNAKLRDFAIAAIEAQPLDYLRTVMKDAVRYIDPTYGTNRPEAGIGPDFVYIATSLAEYPAREETERLYRYEVARGPLLYLYESWLKLSRVPGLLWLAMIASALGGLLLGRDGHRRQLALLGGVAFAIFMTPVLTVTYEYRYSLPGQGLALLTGILGAWTAVQRRAPRPHRGAA